MDDWTARETAQAVAKRLASEFYLEPAMPLEIKLRVERLRLAELLAKAQRQTRLREAVTTHIATIAS